MSTERDEVECLTDKCIEMNLSFGGAADLLIVYLFIKELKNIFKIWDIITINTNVWLIT